MSIEPTTLDPVSLQCMTLPLHQTTAHDADCARTANADIDGVPAILCSGDGWHRRRCVHHSAAVSHTVQYRTGSDYAPLVLPLFARAYNDEGRVGGLNDEPE